MSVVSTLLASLTAEEFIEQVLVRGLGVRHLLIGDDFRFGKGRSGDFAPAAGGWRTAHRFAVEAMTTVELPTRRGTCIGELTGSCRSWASGNLARAEHFLGRPFFRYVGACHPWRQDRSHAGFPDGECAACAQPSAAVRHLRGQRGWFGASWCLAGCASVGCEADDC